MGFEIKFGIEKSTTMLFVGDYHLPCVSIESIVWKDERRADIQINIPYNNRFLLQVITDGVTIDLVQGCDWKRRNVRDGNVHILSMVDIYDLEKVIWNPVINSPDENGIMSIDMYFKCSLRFEESEGE